MDPAKLGSLLRVWAADKLDQPRTAEWLILSFEREVNHGHALSRPAAAGENFGYPGELMIGWPQLIELLREAGMAVEGPAGEEVITGWQQQRGASPPSGGSAEAAADEGDASFKPAPPPGISIGAADIWRLISEQGLVAGETLAALRVRVAKAGWPVADDRAGAGVFEAAAAQAVELSATGEVVGVK